MTDLSGFTTEELKSTERALIASMLNRGLTEKKKRDLKRVSKEISKRYIHGTA